MFQFRSFELRLNFSYTFSFDSVPAIADSILKWKVKNNRSLKLRVQCYFILSLNKVAAWWNESRDCANIRLRPLYYSLQIVPP